MLTERLARLDAQLAERDRVHRNVYTDTAVFEREMRQVFGRAWLFVGHDSQAPEPGDYFTTTLAGRPVVMVRQPDRSMKVLYNRCGHRGALVAVGRTGRVRQFNCMYHGWTFATDGKLIHVPLESGYDGTAFDRCNPQYGMPELPAVDSYNGFVFARLVPDGPGLGDFLGGIRQILDHLTELSPCGSLTVMGSSFRTVYPCNWKIYLENLHDGVHPRFVHSSSVAASRHVASEAPAGRSAFDDFAIGVIQANGQSFSAMDELEVRTFTHGHSDMRGFRKSPSTDPAVLELGKGLAQRHGGDRAAEILARNWHNMCAYPNLSIHPGFLQLRVLTPLSVAETMVEIWAMRLDGAPDEIHHRTIAYANTVHSPTSIIKPDDLEAYKRVQRGLLADGSEWVSNHRRCGKETARDGAMTDSALSEHYIRNQYQAWRGYMEQDEGDTHAG